MYCSKCGRELPPGVSVCPVCSQTDNQTASQPVRREIKRYNYLQANQNYRIIVILWIRSDLYDILDDLDLYMSHSEITTIRTVFLVAVIALIAIEVSTYFATKSVYMGCRLGEKHTEFVSQVDFWDGTTTDLGTRSWYEVETGGILCEYQGYYRYSPRAKVSESTDGPPAWVSIYEAVPSDKLFQPKDAAKLEKQYQIKLNFGDSE